MLQLSAHGKLLITGEYVVLDGAKALALPTKAGQMLTVRPTDMHETIHWKSLDLNGNIWFFVAFSSADLRILDTNLTDVAQRLQGILKYCTSVNPAFGPTGGLDITVQAEFPLEWGLGSSSTLIALIARWAGVDPYDVLENSFGGSGYDIACAFADGPIIYQRNLKERATPVGFIPAFTAQLYFVYLGKKQDSREGIRRYKSLVSTGASALVQEIDGLTREAIRATTLSDFEAVLEAHEQVIARTLDLPRARDLYFQDYPGTIKSLGAWGGDFVLATAQMPHEHVLSYFRDAGFPVCIPYSDMILQD